MTKFSIKVVNIVVSVDLGRAVPLKKLVGSDQELPGVIYKVTDPPAAALIFSSGKIYCTGTKNANDAANAMKKALMKVKKAGIVFSDKLDINIENIIVSTSIKGNLNLKELEFSLKNAEYDTNKHPGVIYKLGNSTFIIMNDGKIICTGITSLDEVQKSLEMLKEKFESIGIHVKPLKIF